MSKDTPLNLSIRGGIARITLNRPQTGNPLDDALYHALEEALEQCLQASARCRCVLLEAEGDVFCSGARHDAVEVAAKTDDEDAPTEAPCDRDPRINALSARLSALAIPTVCAVSGDAHREGADLALACDSVLALQSATFIRPFHNLGLTPEHAIPWLPLRLLRCNRAFTLGHLNETLPAPEAQRWGLIDACVETKAKLTTTARKRATYLAKHPPERIVCRHWLK